MVKKKKSLQETTSVVVDETVVEEDSVFANLRTSLEEISKDDGVIGYILRNTTSATIDLKDPTKIVEYAILSSSALDSSKEISELFDLGNIENILIEGKEIKVLCVAAGENIASVFMEKDANHARILKKVTP